MLDHIQFTLIHEPNIPGSYAVFFFTVSDFTFATRHTHHWVVFLICLALVILFGAISLLFPSSKLDILQPGGYIFLCHLFLPFMGFLWQETRVVFAIPFSSRSCFVRCVYVFFNLCFALWAGKEGLMKYRAES